MIDIRCCDALELLKSLADESVHCIVTSPPYFGLRDYGTAEWKGGKPDCDHSVKLGGTGERSSKQVTSGGTQTYQYKGTCPKCGAIRTDNQIGLEETPQAFIAKLVDIFREARRVLRDDGTLWVNMGDSYVGTQTNNGGYSDKSTLGGFSNPNTKGRIANQIKSNRRIKTGLPEKNLLGIPWRLAFALQDDGWILRSDIIWAKPAPMPESVTDRPTKAHEYIFLFAKQGRYYFDQDAVREPVKVDDNRPRPFRNGDDGTMRNDNGRLYIGSSNGRNIRSVWTVPSEPFSEAHFATYPTKLIEPCIKAGCPVGGIVLDPFMGAGTTGLVALRLGRNFIGCDINPNYVELARKRIQNADPYQPTDKGDGIIQRSLFE